MVIYFHNNIYDVSSVIGKNGLEVLPAFDGAVYGAASVALPQDVLSLVLRYFLTIMRHFFQEYILAEPDPYIRIYHIITDLLYSPRGAWIKNEAI